MIYPSKQNIEEDKMNRLPKGTQVRYCGSNKKLKGAIGVIKNHSPSIEKIKVMLMFADASVKESIVDINSLEII